MKGLVKTRKGDGFVELRDVPEPAPGPGEVLIEVKVASICGSDLHILHDEHPYWPPMVMGHEFSGVLKAVGDGVEGWKAGDRVVSETRTGACGRCRHCQSGSPQICPDKRPPGIGRDGAFARYLVMPANLLHRIPKGLSFEAAALTEPTAVCVHALIERARVYAGERVLICGPGPIGLLSLQICKAAGASLVMVSGTARSARLKLAKAEELGADAIINVGKESLKDRVMALTDGEGADLLVEASGSGDAIQEAFGLVRRHGRVCALGIHGKTTVEVQWDAAVFRALQLTFAFSSSWTSWETALRLMAAGKIETEPLIIRREPLSKWRSVFRDLENGKAIKGVLIP